MEQDEAKGRARRQADRQAARRLCPLLTIKPFPPPSSPRGSLGETKRDDIAVGTMSGQEDASFGREKRSSYHVFPFFLLLLTFKERPGPNFFGARQ